MANNGLGIVLKAGRRECGSAIGYTVGKDGSLILGVIYYLYVRPECRGLGYGKMLVLSLEELLSTQKASLYIASTTSKNIKSQMLFESLGYEVIERYELRKSIGHKAVEALEAAACVYEDDMIMLKPYNIKLLSKLRWADYREQWYTICYKPWLEYMGKTSR